jgi:hypothetical protein
MSVMDVRRLIGDMPQWKRSTATGDGSTLNFIISDRPVITGTATVYVAGTVVTNYSISVEMGLLTFNSAPTGAIESQFSYAELSDESIAAILALQPDIYGAATMAARAIGGRYASLVDKQVGDLRIAYSQRSKQFFDLADRLRRDRPIGASSPWFGGLSTDEKFANAIDTTKVSPFFSRNMEANPPVNSDPVR